MKRSLTFALTWIACAPTDTAGAYEEPIPVFDGWPAAPCIYLQFTPTYDIGKKRAQSSGWTYSHIDGGHFQMLVDPKRVTEELLTLLQKARVKLDPLEGKDDDEFE